MAHPFNLTYHVYIDVNHQYRWYLVAGNGKKIANSGEGYYNRADCVSALNLVAQSGGAPIHYD